MAAVPLLMSDRYKESLKYRFDPKRIAVLLELWDRINWGYVFSHKRGRLNEDQFWSSLWRKTEGARLSLVKQLPSYYAGEVKWMFNVYRLTFSDGAEYELIRPDACNFYMCVPPFFNDKREIL